MTPDGNLASINAIQGIFSLGTAFSNASLQKEMGRYESSQFRINASYSEIAAADAIERGNKEANELKRRLRNLEGEQIIASAASGIDAFSGSAKNVRESTQLLGDLDIIQIKTNAYREAWGYKTQSTSLMNQANMAKLSANRSAANTLITGGLNAANSGLLASYYLGKGVSQKKEDDEVVLPGEAPSNLYSNSRNIFTLDKKDS